MRTIKELLKVLLEHKNKDYSGLCDMVTHLYNHSHITQDEYYKLLRYIGDNRPSKYSSIGAFINRNNPFYWPKYATRYRIRWIKKHIKLNS